MHELTDAEIEARYGRYLDRAIKELCSHPRALIDMAEDLLAEAARRDRYAARYAKQREARRAAAQPYVELIAPLRARGLTYAAIATELNAAGVAHPTAGQWRDSSVRDLLCRYT